MLALDLTAPDTGPAFLNTLRQRALSFHEEGELDAAASAYRQILERFPGDLEARQALGTIALQTGKYRWALQLLSQVAQCQDSADLQDYLGTAFCGLSRLGDALRCYERAIAAQFDHMSARLNRAQVLRALGRLEEAASACARAIELGLDNAEVHTLRGVTLSALGRTEESVACFERALALQPAYVPAHINLAMQLRKLKNDAEAALAEIRRLDEARRVSDLAPAPRAELPHVVELAAPLAEIPQAEAPSAPLKLPSTRVRPLRRLVWSGLLIGAAPTVVSCMLSALLGLELARVAIALLARKSPAIIAAPAPAPAATAGFDVAPILTAHLFGLVVPENQDPAAAMPSKADLKLTGTLATEDPRHGIAIIGGDQGKSHVYSIGESLDGASLWGVYGDHVILERNGSFETLALPRAPSLIGSIVPPWRPGGKIVAAVNGTKETTSP